MTTTPILSVEETHETVTQWCSHAAKRDDLNRRLHARHTFRYPVTLSRGGVEIIGMCRDISKTGIGLLQHECPPVQGPLTVVIWVAKRMLEFDVEICWRKPVGNGWWASGGRFIEGSLGRTALLSARFRGLVERHVRHRYPYIAPITLYPEFANATSDSSDEEQAFMLSQDISLGRMSVVCSVRIAIGTVVYMQSLSSKENGFVRGRVISSSELENGYLLLSLEFEPTTDIPTV